MSINIRSEIIDFQKPVAPNFKSSDIITQRVYPQSNIIGGQFLGLTAAGPIDGNLEFIWTVPAGYRQDCSRSYILFDTIICRSDGAVPPAAAVIVSTTPAFNLPATFFNSGRLELNDQLIAFTNTLAQDDTLFKRLTNSYAKYSTNDSRSLMYGTDAERFALATTTARQQLAWAPSVLLNNEMVLPQNVKAHMTLTVNPLINDPLRSPAFCSQTDAPGDGRVLFFPGGIYMVNTYVKVDEDIPNEIFVPAYSIKSSQQVVATTQNNLQFTVGKDVYKLAAVLQSNAPTIREGAVSTKFSSGTGVDGTAQNAYSRLLTGLQISYAGRNYPATMYSILENTTAGIAGITKSVEPYLDFIAACSGQQDPSGTETYEQFSDPVTLTSRGVGRIFVHNIVVPTTNTATTVEVTANFSANPTSTKLLLFGIEKTVYQIRYGAQKQIESVAVATYN
jgi:hypothetical protein